MRGQDRMSEAAQRRAVSLLRWHMGGGGGLGRG